jgi:hypothetical protein
LLNDIKTAKVVEKYFFLVNLDIGCKSSANTEDCPSIYKDAQVQPLIPFKVPQLHELSLTKPRSLVQYLYT